MGSTLDNTRKNPPITSAFGAVFRRIRRREAFESATIEELPDRMFEALIAAALAKCVEFNVAVNRARKHHDEEFLFVSALRGICEDLIWLAFISRMPEEERKKITEVLLRKTLSDGLRVQKGFFEANNPFQIVLGPSSSEKELSSPTTLPDRQALREFWAARGTTRRDGPTVREMASEIGLNFTYDYVYFMSSNFVHFNPQALLRAGWGDKTNPFKFSVSHLSGYYKSLASFYGAILFIRLYSAFSESHFRESCKQEVGALLDLIEKVHRWPEVVTFEEMNKSPPLYLITHAMRRVFPEQGATDGILAEVRTLGERLAQVSS